MDNRRTTIVAPAPAPAPPSPYRATRDARLGAAAGFAAYLCWGFFPLFFKLLAHVAPVVVLAHRIVWSALFVALLLTGQRRWREVAATLPPRGSDIGGSRRLFEQLRESRADGGS